MGFKSNSDKWFREESRRLDATSKNMAQVMVNRGQMLAPVDTGALVKSGRVVKNGTASYSATFGGASVGVPYAKRRNYENRKNPQTLHYSERSGDSVKKEGIKKYYDMTR